MDRNGFPRPFGLGAWSGPFRHLTRVNVGNSEVAPLTIGDLARIADVEASDLLPIESPIGYGVSGGAHDLREALSGMYSGLGPENISVTAGAGEGLAALAATLAGTDDHCIVQVPTHESIFAALERVGCEATLVPAGSSVERISDAIRGETTAVFVVSPHNPTGLVISADELRRIATDLADVGGVLVVDEVYRGLAIRADVQPAAATLSHNVVSVGSLSKIYGLAGLRVGWVAGPELVVDDVRIVQGYTSRCPSPISETLALVALENQEALLGRSSSLVFDALIELDALCSRHEAAVQLSVPEGGTVAFPHVARVDVDAWCAELVEKRGLLLAPGAACFGLPGRVRVNLGAARSTWDQALPLLDQAFEQLSEISLSRHV